MGIIDSIKTKFGYDAVESNTRRRAPKSDIKSEDDHLIASERRKLVSTVRDLKRNYSLAAWMIRQHVNYVATFSFQGKNKDKELNNHLEKLMQWWSLPGNFDVAKRHGLRRFIRLAEVSRVVDGDVFFYKLNSGHVQAIEGDRVANPHYGTSADIDLSEYKRGVKQAKGGAALSYIVNNRDKNGTRLKFHRIIPAKHIIPFSYYDRYDQIRGISPLASAVNSLQDTYEGLTYALARSKVSQLFALALKRGSADPPGKVTPGETEGDQSEYTVDFGKGPFVLDLDSEDEAQFLESKQPSEEFQSFMEIMMILCLKALDIPYSFYNESFTNYSGARQAIVLYEQSLKDKREDVKELLNSLTYWRLQKWIIDGVIQLPIGMSISDVKWEWQPTGIPRIDQLKEAKGDRESVDGLINSRQRIVKRTLGADYRDILDEIQDEEKEIAQRGLGPVTSDGQSNSEPASANSGT